MNRTPALFLVLAPLLCCLLLLLLPRGVLSAPAVVWLKNDNNGDNSRQQFPRHSSEEVHASEVVRQVLSSSSFRDDADGVSLDGVIFLVGRDGDGTEMLSKMAADERLPLIAARYEAESVTVHHGVTGLDAPRSVAKAAGPGAVECSLDEYSIKLSMLDGGEEGTAPAVGSILELSPRRTRELREARVLVVKVEAGNSNGDDENASSSLLDRIVSDAVDDARIPAVMLAGLRSADEVKHERDLFYRNRRRLQQETGTVQQQRHRHLLSPHSRRLEDQQDQGDGENENNNNNNNNQYMQGIYYVSMTPNILAGVLFTFLFATVTWIAVSCMGMISGQTVYVNKMPSIGREA